MNVGFIGLGAMGSGMAVNLLNAGVGVIGYDVDPAKITELESRGMQVAKSVEEVAGCSVVILCLPNPEVSREVIEKLLTNKTVQTIIETSTLTPEIVLSFAELINGADKKFLSAPMIGGSNSAVNATIQFLVEGDKQEFESQKELLTKMATKVEYMGEIPSATLAKIVFNMCRYANIAVAAEATRLLRLYNPDMDSIYSFMVEQSQDNFGKVLEEDMKQMMTEGVDYQPSQVPEKDLKLFAKIAEENGIDNTLIQAILSTYNSLI